MPGPVNQIKFKHDPNATLGLNHAALIDGRLLNDLIESAATSWPDKPKALLNIKALQRSCNASGEYEILICANCAASGHITTDDIGLRPFQITHDGEYVIWKIDLPTSANAPGALEFRFHQPQYTKSVGAISE